MKQIPRSLYEELIRLGSDGCPLVNLEEVEIVEDDDGGSAEAPAKPVKRAA